MNRTSTLLLILIIETSSAGVYEFSKLSMTKDSKIQELEQELSQVPKVCKDNFMRGVE